MIFISASTSRYHSMKGKIAMKQGQKQEQEHEQNTKYNDMPRFWRLVEQVKEQKAKRDNPKDNKDNGIQ